MRSLPAALLIWTVHTSLAAQHELWRDWPLAHGYETPAPFGDLDGDGYDDLMAGIALDIYTVNGRTALRVLSGRTGSVLYQRVLTAIGTMNSVGDVDGDGFSEFSYSINWGVAIPRRLEIWSPHRDQLLFVVYGPWDGAFGDWCFGIDIDHDGRNEIITATHSSTSSSVFVYDDNGTLLRTINLLQPQAQWIRGIGPVGDIDGDGDEDFGVGLVESTARGAIQLFSGRTGNLIRTDMGTQVGDAIGFQITRMGDLDRDGVPDYVTSNAAGYRGLISVISGANGQVLREWTDLQSIPARVLLAGMDLDLDGFPDVFAGNEYYYNGQPTPGDSWGGRVAAYSGRDGAVLWEEVNWPTLVHPWEVRSGSIALGRGLANLGPQPGNPYPVIVVYDWLTQLISLGPPPTGETRPRLRAIRVNLAGTSVAGAGCSSSGSPPEIAVRKGPAGRVRTTISSALPDAPAWLMAGPATATSWSGYSLPLPLDPWSMPGCTLLVAPELVLHRATGTLGWDAGYAEFTAPFTVATTGLPVALQWLVLSPTTLDFALSRRHDLVLQ